MFTQQIATQSLLHQHQQSNSHDWQIYDPYRQTNLLKDFNPNLQFRALSVHRQFRNQCKLKKQIKIDEQSNCKSLKKLLMRLQSMPSPDKKQRPFPMEQQKNTIPSISSAQLPAKQISTTNLTEILQKLDLNTQKIGKIPSRLLTQQSQRPSRRSHQPKAASAQQEQQQKIRSLIKKKISEKQEFKIRSQKNTVVLKQNAEQMIIPKIRKNSSGVRNNCRKLLNLLC